MIAGEYHFIAVKENRAQGYDVIMLRYVPFLKGILVGVSMEVSEYLLGKNDFVCFVLKISLAEPQQQLTIFCTAVNVKTCARYGFDNSSIFDIFFCDLTLKDNAIEKNFNNLCRYLDMLDGRCIMRNQLFKKIGVFFETFVLLQFILNTCGVD